MKTIAFFVLGISASAVFSKAGEPRITFEKNDAVYIATTDGTSPTKVADGIFPSLSPDGTRLAFNTVEKSGTTYLRHIAVADIAAGKTTVFKDVPSDNSYFATWSPDGAWIAFTFRRDQVWDLGMIKPDGTGFKVIRKGAENATTLYSPCWGGDSASISVTT